MSNDIGLSPAARRAVEALSDPDRLFESGQLAYWMSVAMRWGYENRAAEDAPDALSYRAGWDAGYRAALAEMEHGYPPPPYQIIDGIRVGGDQKAARAEADADRTQRYAGGAVAVWDADRPDPDDLGPSARSWRPGVGIPLERRGASWVWAEGA